MRIWVVTEASEYLLSYVNFFLERTIWVWKEHRRILLWIFWSSTFNQLSNAWLSLTNCFCFLRFLNCSYTGGLFWNHGFYFCILEEYWVLFKCMSFFGSSSLFRWWNFFSCGYHIKFILFEFFNFFSCLFLLKKCGLLFQIFQILTILFKISYSFSIVGKDILSSLLLISKFLFESFDNLLLTFQSLTHKCSHLCVRDVLLKHLSLINLWRTALIIYGLTISTVQNVAQLINIIGTKLYTSNFNLTISSSRWLLAFSLSLNLSNSLFFLKCCILWHRISFSSCIFR